MAAEHLPDRATLVEWLKDSDETIHELTALVDDALQAMSKLIDDHHAERLRWHGENTVLSDALASVRSALKEYMHWDPEEALWLIDDIVETLAIGDFLR